MERPRQPKDIEREDESSLAILGHVIESWESAASSDESLETRREKVIETLAAYLEAMAARADDNDFDDELHNEISEDLALLSDLSDEPAFKTYCEERSEYYTSVREAFIKNALLSE